LTKFQLRPLKPAKVSEISEATASSSTPLEERVNFHIGNPVEDERLIAFYQNLILGSQKNPANLISCNLQELLEEGMWQKSQVDKIKLLCESAVKSVPYIPRGGFLRKKPGKLAELFVEWLTHYQHEPLRYDLGKDSGRREIIFASGGGLECLRVILHTLSDYLTTKPACILFWNLDIPDHLKHFDGLDLIQILSQENEAGNAIQDKLSLNQETATFLVLGHVPSENFRRRLRQLSLRFPLYFIEINNAPNHLSFAREAGLLNSVLRVLTASAIDPMFSGIPLAFILGNADYLKAIETIHFELKGTPAAAEIELLTYLVQKKLDNGLAAENKSNYVFPIAEQNNPLPGSYHNPSQNSGVSRHVDKLGQKIDAIRLGQEDLISPLLDRAQKIGHRLQRLPAVPAAMSDPFLGKHPRSGWHRVFRVQAAGTVPPRFQEEAEVP